ncbi:MAG: dienelactone hydrolase family protein [Alphaproteobacteria bacterium]|nr:MAG: dienelactone hydrolase family protein [Alphaproteobacteria bacterium]
MPGNTLTISSADGDFSAYIALPESGTGPGIVVLQEIFGVNQVMRDRCDWLAAQGFVAVCPDLFWRIEPGIDITDQTEEEWARAFELFGLFNVDTGIDDVDATIETVRGLDACTGKVGTIGYCLGGQLAYLASTRTKTDASVGYYGVNIQTLLEEAVQINHPLMLHIAGKDEFVPPEAQKAIINGLNDNHQVTLHSYPDRDHAFARPGGAHWHEQDAKTANERSLTFLHANLD